MTENKKAETLPAWICIILFLIGFAILGGILAVIVGIFAGFGSGHFKSVNHALTISIINETAMLICTLCISAIMLHFGEHKKMSTLGMSIEGRVGDIFTGMLVAVLIMGGGFYLLISTGDIRISKIRFTENIFFLNMILFVLVAFFEEITFRGYILGRLLRTKMNKFMALCISSVLFMLVHTLNSNVSALPLFNIFLAGLLLGSVYIYTHNLWYSISLHFFWNFLQGPVLGYQVSGMDIGSSVIRLKRSSHVLLNGGDFGFEGSAVCSILVILVFLITIWMMNNKMQKMQKNH